MAQRPRYAPKKRFRTRRSGAEVDAVPDHEATALNRPIIDLEEVARLREAASTKPPAEAEAARSSKLRWVALALVIAATLAGAIAGALAALDWLG